MIKNNQNLLNKFLVFLDACLIIMAFYISFQLKFNYDSPLYHISPPIFGYVPPLKTYITALYILVPGYLIIYGLCNLYGPKRLKSKRKEFKNVFKANCFAILFFIAELYFFKISDRYSRWFIVYFFITNTTFSVVFRLCLRSVLRSFRKRGLNLKHIILVGYSNATEEYIDRIKKNPDWGYRVHGIVADNKPVGFTHQNIPVIARIEKLTSILAENTLDEIAITLGLSEYSRLAEIVNTCEKSGVHTKFIPDYNHIIPTVPQIEDLSGLPVINIRHVPLGNFSNRFIKRTIDIIGAIFAIIIFSIPLIIISILIKTTSKGPLIFSQVRVGRHNKEFKMYKFRSMREQTEAAEKKAWTVKDDPRITRIGRFIRNTSIDELPQLFNVLKGDMSLIGPRPERPFFVEKFKEEIPRYMIKHQVRPGMTGWAQVKGYRGDTSIRKRIDHDLYYIENWTLGLDIKILLMTFYSGFINENAY